MSDYTAERLTDVLAEFPTRTLLDDGTERHMLYSNELNALIAVAEAAEAWSDRGVTSPLSLVRLDENLRAALDTLTQAATKSQSAPSTLRGDTSTDGGHTTTHPSEVLEAWERVKADGYGLHRTGQYDDRATIDTYLRGEKP